MTWEDHTCEECSHWDDINGCWAGGPGRQPGDMACPDYDGDDYDDDDDWYLFESQEANKSGEAAKGEPT